MGDQNLQDKQVKAPTMGIPQEDAQRGANQGQNLRPGEQPNGQNRPQQGQRTPGLQPESPGRNRDQGDQTTDQGTVE